MKLQELSSLDRKVSRCHRRRSWYQ